MGVPMVVWNDGKIVEFLPKPAHAATIKHAKSKIRNPIFKF